MYGRKGDPESLYCVVVDSRTQHIAIFSHHVLTCLPFNLCRFNVAEIGAMSRDIPHEAKILVKRITNDPVVNVTRDWKMVTILIGPNDFCLDFCYQKNPEKSIKNHRRELIATLRTLRDNLPRTIVNLVTPPCKPIDFAFRIKKKNRSHVFFFIPQR